jgi:hypothetical protein
LSSGEFPFRHNTVCYLYISKEITLFSYQLKSLGPAHFSHPLRRSNLKSAVKDEVVHSSGNKEEMAGYVEETARMTQEKAILKKRAGSSWWWRETLLFPSFQSSTPSGARNATREYRYY